jgi:hypothetical protein
LKENLNIDAEIVVMESGAFIDASGTGSLDGLYLLGWGADYPHITNFLDYHFGAANPQFGDRSSTTLICWFKALRSVFQPMQNPFMLKPIMPFANMFRWFRCSWWFRHRLRDVTSRKPPADQRILPCLRSRRRDVFVWMQNAEPISMFVLMSLT